MTAHPAEAYAAFRAGDHAKARALFAAIAAATGSATAWSDLAVAEAALGDYAAARAHHEQALALRQAAGDKPAEAASWHNLGATARALGDRQHAAFCHHQALSLWSAAFGAASPEAARALQSLAALAAEEGADDAAEAFWRQAMAAPAPPQARAALLNNLGVACRNQGKLEEAALCFAAAWQAAPSAAAIAHNWAACLSRLGLAEEAQAARRQALARGTVFVQPARQPNAPRVLIIASAETGNVPLEHILPASSVTRIWWFADHGAARLPPYDLVLNGVGDPDCDGAVRAPAAAFLRACPTPVLNPPQALAATRRDRLAAILAGIPGCVTPPVLRLTAPFTQQDLAAAGLAPPLLLRPAGRHGGQGLARIMDWATLPRPAPGETWYAAPFIDTSSGGYWRKYRMVFVGGVPFPYHLAIAPHWMVHYASAEMPGHAWKLAEEAAFLADWRSALGSIAATALAAIGQALGLDFCGVDFTLLPDGRVLVFEANATMLVHPEAPDGPLAFKNEAVTAITQAVRAMLSRHGVNA